MTARLEPLPVRELGGGLTLVRADTPLARLRGLAGLREIDARMGLELPRCRSVHTLGMRFALDLIWRDGEGAVVRVDRAVPPNRLRNPGIQHQTRVRHRPARISRSDIFPPRPGRW